MQFFAGCRVNRPSSGTIRIKLLVYYVLCFTGQALPPRQCYCGKAIPSKTYTVTCKICLLTHLATTIAPRFFKKGLASTSSAVIHLVPHSTSTSRPPLKSVSVNTILKFFTIYSLFLIAFMSTYYHKRLCCQGFILSGLSKITKYQNAHSKTGVSAHTGKFLRPRIADRH